MLSLKNLARKGLIHSTKHHKGNNFQSLKLYSWLSYLCLLLWNILGGNSHLDYYVFPWETSHFNIKMQFYQYRKFDCGDKMILQLSYLSDMVSMPVTGLQMTLWIKISCVVGCQCNNSIVTNGVYMVILWLRWEMIQMVGIYHVRMVLMYLIFVAG